MNIVWTALLTLNGQGKSLKARTTLCQSHADLTLLLTSYMILGKWLYLSWPISLSITKWNGNNKILVGRGMVKNEMRDRKIFLISFRSCKDNQECQAQSTLPGLEKVFGNVT